MIRQSTICFDICLQEAAELLVATEKKIAVILECSGFDNVEYFCKMFKKYYKMTPTRDRRKKAGE